MRLVLARIYGCITGLRNHLYDSGVLRTCQTPPFVVSVGNIEVGGTGKTPFTMHLAQKLNDRGHKVAIVTRGYRGRLDGPVWIDPSRHSFEDVGDEALLMARSLSIPVIKSPDRVAGAHFAAKEAGADMVILDDGFQHRRIQRDYNICLISMDVSREPLLPAGRLREPASALGRAHCIVHTKGSPGELRADLIPAGLVNRLGDPVNTPITGNVLAFCGIAKPGPFFSQLAHNGINLETVAFGDHHRYTSRDLALLRRKAQGKDLVITTEKDMVRLNPGQLDERWHALRVRMEVSGMERIIREIEDHVHNRCIL